MRELTPELRALHDLARAAAQGAHGVDDLLRRICEAVVERFELNRCAILRLDEATGALEPVSAHGVALEDLPRGRTLADEPIFGRALDTGEAIFIEDIAAEAGSSEEIGELFGVRSVLVVPLVAKGRCLGFLSADRGGEPFVLEQGTLDILTTIGSVAGVFLERAVETSELRRHNELARGFIALASHELRTPAAVVHGIAATLHLRGDLLTDEQRHELRRTLYEQTDRLRRLVDQLLDLSRLEADAIEIRPQTFPVRRRVEELLLMVGGERGPDVELDVPPELETWADPDAFDRVVSNLITNALRYGEPPVHVHARQSDRHLRLSVEDRGRGVPPEFVPRLFERFSRSESSSAASIGAGLGLSIAKSYAQAHGGELLYTPANPHGARFELVLPMRLS